METGNVFPFKSLSDNVGQFNPAGKTLLIPEMNHIGSHLLASAFRGFDINAIVMETGNGTDLGLEYSSGKECYPCHITLGDILCHIKGEKEKRGRLFNADDYIYFMPEAGGPCRFGMYNKYQRIILDSFPEIKGLKIGSLTTSNGYSLDGIIEDRKVKDLRKSAYLSVVIGDILDRLLWRIRPYEKDPGTADDFIAKAMQKMEISFESLAAKKDFNSLFAALEGIIREGKRIIDPVIPPKPMIGIVGEIYLRSHSYANQDLIRVLERHGAEVVNASIGEWINFITYNRLRESKAKLNLDLKQLHMSHILRELKNITLFSLELLYQEFMQGQAFDRATSLIDLDRDHKVSRLEKRLQEEDLFSFNIGTEACLSISGILEYVKEGFNGVVNVYPFTCMPSTITSAVLRPVMNRSGIPYLDTPYDSGIQPGRETAIRTFMYQARQHMMRRGRRKRHIDNKMI
jgi:predicted nucleotide-binding protein (sugar kinase/HSP70/actin superfamily)